MELKTEKPQIFIVSGKARSGKDTAVAIIEDFYYKKNKSVIKLKYSSYIKEYIMNISNWNGRDKTKPRDLLQDLGTELIKNKIDKEMLVRRICEDIKVYSYFFDIIIVSDARLKEEIEIPKKIFKDIKTIRINRLNFDNKLTEKQKNHITETDLDNYSKFDYVIENDKNLKEKIENMLEETK